jgi:hypothetical protein
MEGRGAGHLICDIHVCEFSDISEISQAKLMYNFTHF